jgi:hypothetical protein
LIKADGTEGPWWLWAVAMSERDALRVAAKERGERFDIRKALINRLRVVAVKRKPALVLWSSRGLPGELVFEDEWEWLKPKERPSAADREGK